MPGSRPPCGGGPFGPLRSARDDARDPSASRAVVGWLSSVSVRACGPSRRCDLLHLVSLRLALESTCSGPVCLRPYPLRVAHRFQSISVPNRCSCSTITSVVSGGSPRHRQALLTKNAGAVICRPIRPSRSARSAQRDGTVPGLVECRPGRQPGYGTAPRHLLGLLEHDHIRSLALQAPLQIAV